MENVRFLARKRAQKNRNILPETDDPEKTESGLVRLVATMGGKANDTAITHPARPSILGKVSAHTSVEVFV